MAILGHTLGKLLVEKHIVPDNCVRVLIDIPVSDCVRVYYECLGDDTLLDVALIDALDKAIKVRAKDILKREQAEVATSLADK